MSLKIPLSLIFSCHGPKRTPNPEYTYKAKKKKTVHDRSASTGEPCPPCSERIVKKCVGEHKGSERTVYLVDSDLAFSLLLIQHFAASNV